MVATAHPNERQTNSMVVFWFIWAGQVFSGLGSNIAGFAMTWYLTEQTGSATSWQPRWAPRSSPRSCSAL
jgi:hypothetical protein